MEILNHHLLQPDTIAENKADLCFDLSRQEHRFPKQGQECGSVSCSDAQSPRPGAQLLGKGGDRLEEG